MTRPYTIKGKMYIISFALPGFFFTKLNKIRRIEAGLRFELAGR